MKQRPTLLLLAILFAGTAPAEHCPDNKAHAEDPAQHWGHMSQAEKEAMGQRARERWAKLSYEDRQALVEEGLKRNQMP